MPGAIHEIGGMLDLALQSLRAAVRRPVTWGPEFVQQLRFTIKICFFPLVLTSFALSFGPAGIQASNFFSLVGATDRMGGAYVIIVVRMFAPLVSAIVIAGAAGTAICADLGARKARGELDALAVLGVDPVRSLVVPRLLALVSAAFLFNIFALLAGLLGLVVVVLQNGGALGPVFATFFGNANALELQAAVLKTVVYGALIAIICCYKGMNVSGDAQGVGRAVNQAVVLAFLAIGFTDYVFSQLLLATQPELSQVRG
ncbi:MlaE family ABC transporter permease [Paraconexibacter sp.]|uniref:MlaE family ABC transporter permease n=1 Tax=Paraconexibacter sp. TaxID=2949640 RepID=UPI003567707B